MAPLSLREIKPLERMSKKSTSPALYEALKIIFSHVDKDVWLVGGTALAGFYAAHRQSDDIDLPDFRSRKA